MKKQTYRIRFRHAQWSAGDEVELSEKEAAQMDNAAPGVLELVEQPEPAIAEPAKRAPKEPT